MSSKIIRKRTNLEGVLVMKQNMAELSTRFGNMKQNIAELLYKRDQSLLFTRLNPNVFPIF